MGEKLNLEKGYKELNEYIRDLQFSLDNEPEGLYNQDYRRSYLMALKDSLNFFKEGKVRYCEVCGATNPSDMSLSNDFNVELCSQKCIEIYTRKSLETNNNTEL